MNTTHRLNMHQMHHTAAP